MPERGSRCEGTSRARSAARSLLDSQFNGQLAGRVLAIVDEVQEGAGDNPYRRTNRLKSLVKAEYRELNPKFGRQYREHNARTGSWGSSMRVSLDVFVVVAADACATLHKRSKAPPG